jgi:RND family efflux transporter MFP subunit
VDLAAAQAKVTSAQETANLMKIIAPFDGEIIAVMANTGDPISSGDKALEMVNRSTLKVDALVDEAEISSVSTGNAADVTLDTLPDIILKGKTSLIDPIGSTVNGLVKYTVTILLEPTKQNLLFGSTANVVLYTSDPHSMLAVPLAAVQTDTQGEYVTVVKADGTTARVTITSGDLSGTLVTITTSGDLKEGDQVQLASSSSSSTSTSSSSSNNTMPDAGGGPGGPGGG